MARQLRSWERLIGALLEAKGDTLPTEELDADELNLDDVGPEGEEQDSLSRLLPDTLQRESNISDVIAAVSEAEAVNNLAAARILAEYAYSQAKALDPASEGRGVLQFKTSLQALVGRRLAEVDPSDKSKAIVNFFNVYKRKIAQLQESNDRAALAKAWKIARVLKEVLSSLSAREATVNVEVARAIDDVAAQTEEINKEKYNIVPLDVGDVVEPILELPEVKEVLSFLKNPRRLPSNGVSDWRDVFDYLQFTFGFQEDNVKNQREHIVLLIANDLTVPKSVSLQSAPQNLDEAIQKQFDDVFSNFRLWSNFVKAKLPPLFTSANQSDQILMIALYWLIWGEAANLKFMPELICYIFYEAATELSSLVDASDAQQSFIIRRLENSVHHPYAATFHSQIVVPLYTVVAQEVDFAEEKNHDMKGHEKWRNYDDLNEFFWSSRCLSLGWPLDLTHQFFTVPRKDPSKDGGGRDPALVSMGDTLSASDRSRRLGKTNFTEWRTFWHLYHSFDRMWIFMIVMLQGLTIVAFAGVASLETLQKVLTIFPTIAVLQTLQASTDILMVVGAYRSFHFMAILRKFLRLVISASFAAALLFFCIKMLQEIGQSSRPYLAIYIILILVFTAPRVFVSLLLRLSFLRQRADKVSHWTVVRAFKWLYQEEFFVGRGMYESTFAVMLYSSFWLFLLTCKFLFSYYFQIYPLVSPTSYIVNYANLTYKWHDLISAGNHNLLTVASLWVPVVIIYLLDIQIWYTVLSAIVGGVIGAFWHLGEMRNLNVLRARFRSFPESFISKLQPVTTFQRTRTSSMGRQGSFGVSETPSFRNAKKFAIAWNEIIHLLREEDYVSNEEEELLCMPTVSDPASSLIQWPLFLMANQIYLAIGHVKQHTKSDIDLWRKLCENEYMRCAVVEVFQSVQDLLATLVSSPRGITEERRIVDLVLQEVNDAIAQNNFGDTFNLSALKDVHLKLVALTSLLIQPRDQAKELKVSKALRDLFKVIRDDFLKYERTQLSKVTLHSMEGDSRVGTDIDFFSEITWPTKSTKLMRLHLLLTLKDSAEEVPVNLEARRRLLFFCNSLFMRMPDAPRVRDMLPFCVMTPYYSEIVAYSLKELYDENEDGISTLFYLQKIFPDEWKNFLERIGCNDRELKQKKKNGEDMTELRMWVSFRGQTLARTVRGMMYYRRAIQLLAFLEEKPSGNYRDVESGLEEEEDRLAFLKDSTRALADLKFTYVVTCQIYGKQRKDKDSRYFDIFDLMKRHPGLRIAYIDEQEVKAEDGKSWKEYYSVLLRVDKFGQEQEVFRIRLPGPAKLGEGKPENQNHAIIFTRGRAIQTIDMNQDNYFEETLKMRNLLQEFYGEGEFRNPTILGVREHVFTGSVSSLASFMSNQESSFVTLGQRVLAYPLKVRMHYGHPDVFDRIFHLTRGGVSKSSKLIHISEDIFAGFNTTLRQGNVTHHEYIQVGKGRDVGLNQIALFEAKVASGNGEQTLSRDIYRLGQEFDFFRMMSFYFTSVGFYLCTLMTVWCVYAFLYGKVYLALSGVEAALKERADIIGNAALQSAISSQFLIQVGVFTAVPMIVVFLVENGLPQAILNFITMQLQLASVFFTFSLGTRSHYFARTILHGGAKYRSTGRGFVVRHEKFAELYRFFSRSHFTRGLEVSMLLIVYLVYGASSSASAYILLSVSSWFMAISWCFAPYIFNPSGFEWQKTVEDFEDWRNWLLYKGGIGVKGNLSWEAWWEDEVSHVKTFRSRVWDIFLNLRFFLFQYGIVYNLSVSGGSTSITVYMWSWIVAGGIVLLFWVSNIGKNWDAQLQVRALQSFLLMGSVITLVLLLILTSLTIGDVMASILVFIPTGWGLLQIAIALRPLFEILRLWKQVRAFARMYDALMGGIIFLPIAILSWFPFFSTFQSRLMFNQAFSRGLEISLILSGKKDEDN